MTDKVHTYLNQVYLKKSIIWTQITKSLAYRGLADWVDKEIVVLAGGMEKWPGLYGYNEKEFSWSFNKSKTT